MAGDKIRLADVFILLILGCGIFFHFRGVPSTSPEETISRRPVVLFFLDFRDFMCLSCLESFLDFYQRLPYRLKTEDTWGILLLDDESEDDRTVRIARMKLQGFVQANNILSPVLVDRSLVFQTQKEMGSAVVLFDDMNKRILRYDFPLKPQQIVEILKLLSE